MFCWKFVLSVRMSCWALHNYFISHKITCSFCNNSNRLGKHVFKITYYLVYFWGFFFFFKMWSKNQRTQRQRELYVKNCYFPVFILFSCCRKFGLGDIETLSQEYLENSLKGHYFFGINKYERCKWIDSMWDALDGIIIYRKILFKNSIRLQWIVNDD